MSVSFNLNTKKIFGNLFAHLFGQVVTVLTTILIPWICLANWSAEDFGYWVVISAISQFFIVADFGVSSAIVNHICMDLTSNWIRVRYHILQGLKLVARRVFFTLVVATTISVLVFISLGTHSASKFSAAVFVLLFLIFATSMQPLNNMYMGYKRAQGKNSVGVFVVNITRFFELLTLSGAVYLGADLLGAAIVFFTTRILCSILILLPLISARRDISYFPLEELPTSVDKAGWGFATNFAALNIALHGFVLAASTGGPAIAASFAAARTASRIPSQPVGMAYSSITPELSLLYAQGRHANFWRIALRMSFFSTLFTVAIGFVVYFYSQWLELHWLHGKLVLDKTVLLLLISSMVFHVLWQSGSQILAAINKTFRLGVVYLLLSVISVVLAVTVLSSLGAVGIALAWLILEICMVAVVGFNVSATYRQIVV